MSTITISLADERLAQLRFRAERSGLTPEEYLQRHLEDFLDSDEEFREAANYVLKKNAELYRRLA
jgi:antitoxin FitA